MRTRRTSGGGVDHYELLAHVYVWAAALCIFIK